jgi:hypothetical protein
VKGVIQKSDKHGIGEQGDISIVRIKGIVIGSIANEFGNVSTSEWCRNDRVRVPFQIVAQQFMIKNLVIPFCRVQGLRQVTTWMVLLIFISLKEHGSGSNK